MNKKCWTGTGLAFLPLSLVCVNSAIQSWDQLLEPNFFGPAGPASLVRSEEYLHENIVKLIFLSLSRTDDSKLPGSLAANDQSYEWDEKEDNTAACGSWGWHSQSALLRLSTSILMRQEGQGNHYLLSSQGSWGRVLGREEGGGLEQQSASTFLIIIVIFM